MAVRESLPRTTSTRTRVSLVDPSSNLDLVPRPSAQLDDLVLALGVGLAHQALGELAHAGLGHLVDVSPALGQLPARDAGGQVVTKVLGRDVDPVPDDHAGERGLAPAFVRDADDGG